jgi:hypothetical protein
MLIESARDSAGSALIARRATDDDSSSEGFLTDEVRLFMCRVINRITRGCALSLVYALVAGCHHHAANPTTLAPDLGGVADAEPESPLLSRGDKVLVVIDGEKKGTGTYNGQRVVLDPPLDTLTPSRIDSTRVRVGPAARELYGVSYRMVGVLLVWLHPAS